MDLNELGNMFVKLEATLVSRLDDIVRRIDGFERRLDKHEEQMSKIKDEHNLWKGGLLLLGLVYPVLIKMFWN
jgi:hypothetical protein